MNPSVTYALSLDAMLLDNSARLGWVKRKHSLSSDLCHQQGGTTKPVPHTSRSHKTTARLTHKNLWVMEAITGTAQQSAPLPLGVQHAVDTLSLLMAGARQKDSKSAKSGVENVDVAGATGAHLGKVKVLASRAEKKGNNQGGVRKRCGSCGWTSP